MKGQAVAELKHRLFQKFGESAEVQGIVEKEVAKLIKTKTKISVDDLNSLENRLLRLVGFPEKRRIRWSSLHTSVTAVSKSLTAASNRSDSGIDPAIGKPPCDPHPSVHLQSLNKSVPTVPEITEITRHWKAGAMKKSSPIFPRYEARSEYTPSPDRNRGTDAARTTFNWGHGRTEDLRFRGVGTVREKSEKGLDQWGDILRWDTTKYMWEQEDARRTNGVLKLKYREELNAQIKAKEQAKAAEKGEMAKERTETEEQLAKFLEKTEKEAQIRKEKDQQNQASLQHMLNKKEEEQKRIAQEEKKERELLQHKHEQDLLEELERFKTKRLHHQSLGDENIRTLLNQREELDRNRLQSQMRERQLTEDYIKRKTAEEEKLKDLYLQRTKEVQEENKRNVVTRKQPTPDSGNIAHLELFQQHDFRVSQAHEQQRKNVTFLSKQMMEKTAKDEVWKQLTNEQAELWSRKEAAQVIEDKQKETAQKQKKELMKRSLIAQMQERRERKIAAGRLSSAEAKINRSLVQAATGSWD